MITSILILALLFTGSIDLVMAKPKEWPTVLRYYHSDTLIFLDISPIQLVVWLNGTHSHYNYRSLIPLDESTFYFYYYFPEGIYAESWGSGEGQAGATNITYLTSSWALRILADKWRIALIESL